MLGAAILASVDQIAVRLFHPNLYQDIRLPLAHTAEINRLPPLGTGEFSVWAEFPDPLADLTGLAWQVTTVDLADRAIVDLDNEGGASSHSGDGTSGVRIGRMRIVGGHRYEQIVRLIGSGSEAVVARHPTVLIMAAPGVRKGHGFRWASRQLAVGGCGLLIMTGGMIVGCRAARRHRGWSEDGSLR